MDWASIDKKDFELFVEKYNSVGEILQHLNLRQSGGNYKTVKTYLSKYGLFEKILQKSKIKSIGPLIDGNKRAAFQKADEFIEYICTSNKDIRSNFIKKYLLKFKIKENKCDICGSAMWNNKVLCLQIHHKDGKHSNNHIDNLQLLCPNCHSQTENFAGKKLKKSENPSIRNKCPNCNGPKYRQSKLCIKCRQVERYNDWIKNIPVDIKTLKDLLHSFSYVKVAQMYGVTDNCIRKWEIKLSKS